MTHTKGEWRVEDHHSRYNIIDGDNRLVCWFNDLDIARFIVACRNAFGDEFTVEEIEGFGFGGIKRIFDKYMNDDIANEIAYLKLKKERDELAEQLSVAREVMKNRQELLGDLAIGKEK